MKLSKRGSPALAIIPALAFPVLSPAAGFPDILSTEWLGKNMAGEYNAGHVPGSIHRPRGTWDATAEKLDNQVPDD